MHPSTDDDKASCHSDYVDSDSARKIQVVEENVAGTTAP